MSNPMLAGLTVARGDPRFALPPIKSADGKGNYAPKAPPKIQKAKDAEVAAQVAAGRRDLEAPGEDMSDSIVLSLAAACVKAAEPTAFATSAYFWREAARDMRLEGGSRKEEWADWAVQRAAQDEANATKSRVKAKKREPEPVMDEGLKVRGKAQFTVTDRARYAKAKAFALHHRERQKAEEKAGAAAEAAAKQRTGGGRGPTLDKQAMAFIAMEDDDEVGRKDKAYWKADKKKVAAAEDSDSSDSDSSDSDSDSDSSSDDGKKKKKKKKKKKGKAPEKKKKGIARKADKPEKKKKRGHKPML